MHRIASASLAIVLVTLAPPAPAGDAGEVVLELSSTSKSAWLDTPAMIELTLKGRGVSRVVAQTPGLQLTDGSNPLATAGPDRFVMRFEVKPAKAGELVLGPYSLTFNGRKLRSNRLVLKVLEPPKVTSAVQMTATPAAVELGRTFRLDLTANNEQAHKAELMPSDRYKIKSQSTSTSYSFTSGTKSERHVRTYELEPLQPGKLVLGRADLEGLAPGIEVGQVSVEVRPKSQ